MRIRNKWIELYLPSGDTHWCLHLDQPSDGWDEDKRYRLVFGLYRMFLVIKLWKGTPYSSFEGDAARYGFTFFERTIHLHLGKTHVYSLPWDWTIVRSDLILPDGNLYFRNTYPRKTGEKHLHWYDVFERSPRSDVDVKYADYVELTHKTMSGDVQQAKIRMTGEEREWRWTWLRWLPWPKHVSRTIYCESDVELGEKAGSWKGGMMGWSCPWKHGETMEEAFWRWYSKWNGV